MITEYVSASHAIVARRLGLDFTYGTNRTFLAFEQMRQVIAAKPQEEQRQAWGVVLDIVDVLQEVHRILEPLPPRRREVLRGILNGQPWSDRVSLARVMVQMEQHPQSAD